MNTKNRRCALSAARRPPQTWSTKRQKNIHNINKLDIFTISMNLNWHSEQNRPRKNPPLLREAGFHFWCGWQELNPRPLGS
jgi:hypothetical protein